MGADPTVSFTATGHGYYRVLVDGEQVSQHLAEREALESAANHYADGLDVRVIHDYEVRVVKDYAGNIVRVRVKTKRLQLNTPMAIVTYTKPGFGESSPDTVPDAFAFATQTDVALGTVITSEYIEVTGTTLPSTITISGTNNPSYQINGRAWTNAAGTIGPGENVRVRHESSAFNGISIDTTLTIGGVSDTFTSTTQASAGSTPSWTELTPSSDSRLIYVDATNGISGGPGTDYFPSTLPGGTWDNPSGITAYQTIAQGKAQMRDGFPDYLLLKKGETWYEGIGQWILSGRSATEPMVVSAYGTGARPVLKNGNTRVLYTEGGGGSPDVMAYNVFKGLRFYAHTRDPNNTAEYTGPSSEAAYAVRFGRGTNWVLFEDMYISHYGDGLIFEDGAGFGVFDVQLRYNVIVDQYRDYSLERADYPSVGIYVNGTTRATLEGNIMDHNGWLSEDNPNAIRTIYNHNMYLQQSSTLGTIDVLNNILMRGSSHACQNRSGGLNNGNLVIENAIGLLQGGGTAPLGYNGKPGSMEDNVILNSDDISLSLLRGRGIAVEEGLNVNVQYNILSTVFGGDPVSINTNTSDVTVSDNIIHDWQAGDDTGVPGDYDDPTRSIESYSTSVGGAGTRADFYAQLRLQSQDNFNSDYAIPAIKDYFRAGFEPVYTGPYGDS